MMWLIVILPTYLDLKCTSLYINIIKADSTNKPSLKILVLMAYAEKSVLAYPGGLED